MKRPCPVLNVRVAAASAGVILSAVVMVGCDRPASVERETTGVRYPLVGDVVEADRDGSTLTIDHEAVGDYMAAMTMPFNVRDTWVFDVAEPGARVKATLVVDGLESWIEDVVITRPPSEGAAAEVVIAAPDPGASVPSIDLVDQSGARVSLDDYHGSYYAYTFIYTRCPLPDFCPRMSENFVAIFAAVEADPATFGDLELLSISIDPDYDTPMVLAEYAQRYLGPDATFDRWRFATSDEPGLHDLGGFSGLRFRPDRDEVVHSLRTVLVDPQGHVIKSFVGNNWDPSELLEALQTALAEPPE